MNNNHPERMLASWIRLATVWLAAALTEVLFLWLWLAFVDGRAWLALPPAVIFALTAGLGIAWLTRARTARRWNAFLDAYATEEIAQEQRWLEMDRERQSQAPEQVTDPGGFDSLDEPEQVPGNQPPATPS